MSDNKSRFKYIWSDLTEKEQVLLFILSPFHGSILMNYFEDFYFKFIKSHKVFKKLEFNEFVNCIIKIREYGLLELYQWEDHKIITLNPLLSFNLRKQSIANPYFSFLQKKTKEHYEQLSQKILQEFVQYKSLENKEIGLTLANVEYSNLLNLIIQPIYRFKNGFNSYFLFDAILENYQNHNQRLKIIEEKIAHHKSQIKNFELGLISLYNDKGNIYAQQGALEEAKKYYRKAIKIFESNKKLQKKHMEFFARTYQNLGNVFSQISTPNSQRESIVYYKRAIRIYDSLPGYKKLVHQSMLNVNMGLGLIDIEKLDEAEKTLLKGYKISKEISHYEGCARALNGLAICYYRNEEFQKGIDVAKEAITIWEDKSNDNTIGVAYQNLALNLEGFGDSEKALIAQHKALNYMIKANNFRGQGQLFNNFALMKIKKGLFEEGKSYLKKAIQCTFRTQDSYLMKSIFSNARLLEKESGDNTIVEEFSDLFP